MKITKISPIRDYRIFRRFEWSQDLPPFTQYNLVYGWNGTGKSTLSGILQAVERRNAIDEGELVIHFDGGGTVRGRDLASDRPLPHVRVFNRSFVESSVFRAERGVAPIYFLGKESTERGREIERLEDHLDRAGGLDQRLAETAIDISKATKTWDDLCIAQAKRIKELLRSAGENSYNNYDKATYRQRVEEFALRDAITRESARLLPSVATELRRQKDGERGVRVAAPSRDFPNLHDLTREVEELLASAVTNAKLEDLAMDSELAEWVRRGVHIHKLGQKPSQAAASTCKFCDGLLSPERISALLAHFNDSFGRFLVKGAALRGALERTRDALAAVDLPRPAELASHLRDKFEAAVGRTRRLLDSYVDHVSSLIQAVDEKRRNPFAPYELTLPSTASREPSAFLAVSAKSEILGIIQTHNREIDEFDALVADARRRLEEDVLAQSLDDYKVKKAAPDDLRAKRMHLESEKQAVVRQIQELERLLVEHHQPADELNAELKAYLGRDELTFSAHEGGYSIRRSGQTATNISEGERTAIAFLYFLKSLKDKSFDMSTGVVVIDDPVSSLDSNSLFCAFAYMQKRTMGAGQLFILTHNFPFFRQAKNWLKYLQRASKGTKTAIFMLDSSASDGARTSALIPLDPLLARYESEYHYLFNKVLAGASEHTKARLEEYYGLPNIARRLLESFMAFRYPTSGSLREKLGKAKVDPAAAARIDRFVNAYSHEEGGSDEFDATLLAESPLVMQAILDLMRTEDAAHFNQMIELCSSSNATRGDAATAEAGAVR